MNLTKMLFSFLALATVGAVAMPAHANDLYVHGASCWSPSPSVAINQYGIFNNGSSAVTVYCPLAITNQLGQIQFTIAAYDRSATDNVSCALIATAPDGTLLNGSPFTLQTSGSGLTQQVLQSANFGISGPHYYAFSCSIPGVGAAGISIFSALYFKYN
jgi:hypothetical protein